MVAAWHHFQYRDLGTILSQYCLSGMVLSSRWEVTARSYPSCASPEQSHRLFMGAGVKKKRRSCQSCLQNSRLHVREGPSYSVQLGLCKGQGERCHSEQPWWESAGDLQTRDKVCICIHRCRVSMRKVAQVGSKRSRGAEPGPGMQVPGWLIPLEGIGLLLLGVQAEEEKLPSRSIEKGDRTLENF